MSLLSFHETVYMLGCVALDQVDRKEVQCGHMQNR